MPTPRRSPRRRRQKALVLQISYQGTDHLSPRRVYDWHTEQWIKEGKKAVKWTKLSCHTFKDNQARLQFFALAYNLGKFLRRLASPKPTRHWSLTTLREKLIKIGAKVTWHAKYMTFQLAEVAVTRNLFAAILARIARLALPPPVVGRMPA